ncbi:hypothetical protein CAOG_08573 [Capsaspora owczarzaki ATCC 30864]|uniref:Rho-GAP domain-containing protein n=1 Tax=Capsaspora owczarzaki (strain ATCC 30864) TaxID=595528 RepID=A0A0D2VL26_CAPO3|nr:hypothetical protein CAOG_08573 [Capsaspora owczarzaki ATCC 30864]KJE90797.1 hypothetical protein, variant [Capsaspora owczarzaki ATCC 30864]|eukprot:XP_011270173.1 hypothetical protein CAOG_08573 [Capsaspora owczarzaki ATCC 30864]
MAESQSQSQLDKVLHRTDDLSKAVKDLKIFLKKKLELDESYARELTKLARDAEARRPSFAGQLVDLWDVLVSSLAREGTSRLGLVEKTMQVVIETLTSVHRDELEEAVKVIAAEPRRLSSELTSSMAEISRAKTKYESVAKEYEQILNQILQANGGAVEWTISDARLADREQAVATRLAAAETAVSDAVQVARNHARELSEHQPAAINELCQINQNAVNRLLMALDGYGGIDDSTIGVMQSRRDTILESAQLVDPVQYVSFVTRHNLGPGNGSVVPAVPAFEKFGFSDDAQRLIARKAQGNTATAAAAAAATAASEPARPPAAATALAAPSPVPRTQRSGSVSSPQHSMPPARSPAPTSASSGSAAPSPVSSAGPAPMPPPRSARAAPSPVASATGPPMPPERTRTQTDASSTAFDYSRKPSTLPRNFNLAAARQQLSSSPSSESSSGASSAAPSPPSSGPSSRKASVDLRGARPAPIPPSRPSAGRSHSIDVSHQGNANQEMGDEAEVDNGPASAPIAPMRRTNLSGSLNNIGESISATPDTVYAQPYQFAGDEASQPPPGRYPPSVAPRGSSPSAAATSKGIPRSPSLNTVSSRPAPARSVPSPNAAGANPSAGQYGNYGKPGTEVNSAMARIMERRKQLQAGGSGGIGGSSSSSSGGGPPLTSAAQAALAQIAALNAPAPAPRKVALASSYVDAEEMPEAGSMSLGWEPEERPQRHLLAPVEAEEQVPDLDELDSFVEADPAETFAEEAGGGESEYAAQGDQADDVSYLASLGPYQSSVPLPPILAKCLAYLEEQGLQEEGLFRVPGDVTKIKALKQQFDTSINVDLRSVLDPSTVAGLLKLWLRETREPPIPKNMTREFNAIVSSTEPEHIRVHKLRAALDALPTLNREMLASLVHLFVKVIAYGHVNKMSLDALARSIGLSLFNGSGVNFSISMLKMLVNHCSLLFPHSS